MNWKLGDNELHFEGQAGASSAKISCPNHEIATGYWHEVIPSLCRFRLTGNAKLKVEVTNAGVELTALGDGGLELVVSPLIPLVGGGQSPHLACWPLISGAGGAIPGLLLSADIKAGFRLTLDTRPWLRSLAAATKDLPWRLAEATTSIFKRHLLKFREHQQGIGAVRLNAGSVELADDALQISQVTLRLEMSGPGAAEPALELSPATLAIGLDDLRLRLDAGAFSARLKHDAFVFADPARPLTLLFHRHTEFSFFPAMGNARVEAKPAPGQPALTVFIPGGDLATVADAAKPRAENRRFILELKPGAEGKLVLGANGLSGTAEARPVAVKVGDGQTTLECAVTEGVIAFENGRFDARVTASARLPYFRGSEGNLSVQVSSESKFAATWTLSPGQVWTDPTRHLEVHDPRAAVTIKWGEADGLTVSGRVGGRLELVKTPRFLGDAGRWLGKFAEGLRLEFDNLSLGELGKPEIRVALQPVNLPRGLNLWGLFKLDLQRFELLSNGFRFGGELGFSHGGLSFSGSFPWLRCSLSVRHGIGIRAEAGDAVSISGRLSTPGGVGARMSFRRHQSETVDELVGAGSLSAPGLPAISVLCMLGRRQDRGRVAPIFLFYAEAGLSVPLFPGVVLRDMGLGFGVNKVLAAISDVPPQEVVSRLMNGPMGLPDAGLADSWTTNRTGFDLSLVAQTSVAPATHGDGPFPYVGRAMLYARPTTEFVLLFGANLWLMTSLEDSRRPDFNAKPAMKGAMVLFPRHGFLEMQVRTERGPKSTSPLPLLSQALAVVSGEFYLRASRDTFLFRAGPFRAGFDVAGIRLQGQAVYAVYVGRRGAISVMQASLEGRTHTSWAITLGFGPLTVTAGFEMRLALAFETVLAGMFLTTLKCAALYARVRVYVMVELTARLTIRFRLTIKVWRFRKTISWSKSFGATFRLSIDLRLELVLSSRPALYGKARVEVRLFGYGFAPEITLGNPNHEHLRVARQELADLLTSPARA